MVTKTHDDSATEVLPPSQHPSGWRRYLTPSIGDVVFITIFSIALILGGSLTQRDGDFAKHLELGRSVIEDGRLPTVDIYSHTMTGGEMVPHEWLAQTLLAATERWFGFDGIGVLTAALAALPWFIMYRWLVRRGAGVALAVLLALLGAAASMIHWASRPHAFTWLFVVVWVILLEDLRRGHRSQVWILVILAVVWANTHGAFPVGFVLLGAYLVGALLDGYRKRDWAAFAARARHLSLVLLATFAASFINPTGWHIVAHPFQHLGDDFLFDFTREFTSPDFHNLLFWPFLAMILLTLVLSFHWNPTSLLLAAAWTALALYSFRHIPLYALVVTPILAENLEGKWQPASSGRLASRWREYASIERRVVGGSLSLVLIAFTAFSMSQAPGSSFEFGPGFFPVEAVESIEDSLPGDHVFNQFVWGGYLVYCCHPDVPVFIDGQTDYYGPELTREYDQTIRGRPAWREVFDRYDIDWVLISPDTGLAQVLAETDDWAESYRDQTAVIYVSSP